MSQSVVATHILKCPDGLDSDFNNKQVLRKAASLLECQDHPLWIELNLLPSGRRFSFVPAAIIQM